MHDQNDEYCLAQECQLKGPYPDLQKKLMEALADAGPALVGRVLFDEITHNDVERGGYAVYLALSLADPHDSQYQFAVFGTLSTARHGHEEAIKAAIDKGLANMRESLKRRVEHIMTAVQHTTSIEITGGSLARVDELIETFRADKAKDLAQRQVVPGVFLTGDDLPPGVMEQIKTVMQSKLDSSDLPAQNAPGSSKLQ